MGLTPRLAGSLPVAAQPRLDGAKLRRSAWALALVLVQGACGQLWALCGCPCSFPSSLSLPRAFVTLGVEFFQMLFCITYRLIWFFFHRLSVWWVTVKVFYSRVEPALHSRCKPPLSVVYFSFRALLSSACCFRSSPGVSARLGLSVSCCPVV